MVPPLPLVELTSMAPAPLAETISVGEIINMLLPGATTGPAMVITPAELSAPAARVMPPPEPEEPVAAAERALLLAFEPGSIVRLRPATTYMLPPLAVPPEPLLAVRLSCPVPDPSVMSPLEELVVIRMVPPALVPAPLLMTLAEPLPVMVSVVPAKLTVPPVPVVTPLPLKVVPPEIDSVELAPASVV